MNKDKQIKKDYKDWSKKEDEKQFEKLQKKNNKIREDISNLLYAFFIEKEYHPKFFKKINALINNEIEQEEMCEQ